MPAFRAVFFPDASSLLAGAVEAVPAQAVRPVHISIAVKKATILFAFIMFPLFFVCQATAFYIITFDNNLTKRKKWRVCLTIIETVIAICCISRENGLNKEKAVNINAKRCTSDVYKHFICAFGVDLIASVKQRNKVALLQAI